ncbi:MAG: 16S rRNA (cytosine(1402)-N(4))-methyltransferase RsmH [Clostridia bacterium]|nr:16S rRNA (cytosine(1402)-N(4))-methyltransferase RsmH [Clostridia bacterium]
MSQNFSHRSVLLDECIEALAIRPDGTYVDGTAGGGGHSFAIASRLSTGSLIAIDRDEAAIHAAGERLAPLGECARVVRSNFSDIASVLDTLQIERIDGLLLDLGVSSHQFDEAERGFSYRSDAPLDMRMDRRQQKSAYDVVNSYSEEALRRILYEYGEERFAPRIAARIVSEREKAPIRTTNELSELIKSAMPAAARDGGHPAKRSFQAIRIEVNGELDVIAPTIEQAVARMNQGGRVAIITFHSLEDRIVKQAFQHLAAGCTCPKSFPVCVCGNRPKIRIITKKPILPSPSELSENPRSHSAKLRVAEKI